MVVLYDAKRPTQSLLRYNGTLWEHVLFNGWFWLFLAGNLFFIGLRVAGILHNENAPLIPKSTLQIVGALVSFGMVIFLNIVLNRFNDQLKMMVAIGGDLFTCVSLAVSTFGRSAEARTVQLARYGNAMNHLCYYTMGNVSNWEYLLSKNILLREEVDILKAYKGKKTNLLGSWMLDTLRMAQIEGDRSVCLREMQGCVMNMRRNTSMLQHIQAHPPALGYYHFLVVVLHSWLALLAYSTAYIPSKPEKAWIVFLPYIVVLFAYMGLSAIAYAHVEPFGEDSSDVDIITEIDGVLRQTQFILKESFHPALHNPPVLTRFDSEVQTSPSMATTPSAGEATSSITLPEILEYLAPRSKTVSKYCDRVKISELGNIVRTRHTVPKNVGGKSSQDESNSHSNVMIIDRGDDSMLNRESVQQIDAVCGNKNTVDPDK